MARAGPGDRWRCLFANDCGPKKTATYAQNWGEDGPQCGDVRDVSLKDPPRDAGLAWASSPCRDLSLTGAGAGLEGRRSSAFRLFRDLMAPPGKEGRAPRMTVLENVCGALASHDGRDSGQFAVRRVAGVTGFVPLWSMPLLSSHSHGHVFWPSR